MIHNLRHLCHHKDIWTKHKGLGLYRNLWWALYCFQSSKHWNHTTYYCIQCPTLFNNTQDST